MEGKLPVYRLTITDKESDAEEIFTALVDRPAIESNFVAFNKSEPIQFEVTDSDRRIITGAVMIPDFQIYRKDEKRGEHYVYFTKEDIELFVRDWAKGNRYNSVNEMHERSQQPDGIYLIESIVVDAQRGTSAPIALKQDYPDGTWLHSYYVESDELWARVKSGEFKGFSMEMMVDYIFASQKPETDHVSELMAVLDTFIKSTK
jgi:hypothetical protein